MLLEKIIGTSQFAILIFEFVKKNGSGIHDHKNLQHDLLCEIFRNEIIGKSSTCIYPIIGSILLKCYVHYFYYSMSGFSI